MGFPGEPGHEGPRGFPGASALKGTKGEPGISVKGKIQTEIPITKEIIAKTPIMGIALAN